MLYSMAFFHMFFAGINHYAGRNDSLGIIDLPAKTPKRSVLSKSIAEEQHEHDPLASRPFC
jgi:hypothetical protein